MKVHYLQVGGTGQEDWQGTVHVCALAEDMMSSLLPDIERNHLF